MFPNRTEDITNQPEILIRPLTNEEAGKAPLLLIDQLVNQVFDQNGREKGSVVLAAKEILEIACEKQVDLQWVDGACQIQISDLGETRREMPKSYFRALLGRLSTLFSESMPTPSDWNFYQAHGRLAYKRIDGSEIHIEMTFENTQQRQFVHLNPIAA